MCIWFFISVLGIIVIMPLLFLSVEHLKLQKRYGNEKGTKIGAVCSLISGWGFFLFWIGIWVSPQPRFIIPLLQNLAIVVPVVNFSIPLLHLMVFAPFFAAGTWLGIKGVKEATLKVAETHKTEKIVKRGVYSSVRHPQYLGGLLAHVGISFLLSAWFSLLSTPLMVVLVYLLSRKEEKELLREFGKEYVEYKEKVPMLIPNLRKLMLRQLEKNES